MDVDVSGMSQDDHEFMREFKLAKFKIIRDEYPGIIYYIGCLTPTCILIGCDNKTYEIPSYKLEALKNINFLMCQIDVFGTGVYLATRKPITKETRRILVGSIIRDLIYD